MRREWWVVIIVAGIIIMAGIIAINKDLISNVQPVSDEYGDLENLDFYGKYYNLFFSPGVAETDESKLEILEGNEYTCDQLRAEMRRLFDMMNDLYRQCNNWGSVCRADCGIFGGWFNPDCRATRDWACEQEQQCLERVGGMLLRLQRLAEDFDRLNCFQYWEEEEEIPRIA